MSDKDLPHFSRTDEDEVEDEDEDEDAMQAALREMVKIPDIDSQHRHPGRAQLNIEDRDVWTQRLLKSSSPDKQQKWARSKVQESERRNTSKTAESMSSRACKEEEKAKNKQSETWAERLKKSSKSEKPKQPEIRTDTPLKSNKSFIPDKPKESVYCQIATPSKLIEQNIQHPLMDQHVKMMRIEAAANPKSYNPSRSTLKHMASTQTPYKMATTVATNTDAELDAAPTTFKQPKDSISQQGVINILTVPFRASLDLAPGNDEDMNMPQEEMPPSMHFRNLPVFGRNRFL